MLNFPSIATDYEINFNSLVNCSTDGKVWVDLKVITEIKILAKWIGKSPIVKQKLRNFAEKCMENVQNYLEIIDENQLNLKKVWKARKYFLKI